MSVTTQLVLSDPTKELLGQAREAWPRWREQRPDLGVIEDLLDLPTWIRAADRTASDGVLHRLAELASPTGADDVTAAGALAWLLLPGACVVAHRLRTLTSRIDEVVAAQLWLEVRPFPWQRQRKVATNIVKNTRRGVLRELGVGQSARGADPAWAAVPTGSTTIEQSHGRRATRTIKVIDVPALPVWPAFPCVAQVAQLRRTLTRAGKKTVEVVSLVTSATHTDAPPAVLAAWVRGHWAIGNRLH